MNEPDLSGVMRVVERLGAEAINDGYYQNATLENVASAVRDLVLRERVDMSSEKSSAIAVVLSIAKHEPRAVAVAKITRILDHAMNEFNDLAAMSKQEA